MTQNWMTHEYIQRTLTEQSIRAPENEDSEQDDYDNDTMKQPPPLIEFLFPPMLKS